MPALEPDPSLDPDSRPAPKYATSGQTKLDYVVNFPMVPETKFIPSQDQFNLGD